MTKDTEVLREALEDMCAAMEYWAGCDEGCSENEATSEIMSGGGAWPATSYEQSRALIAALATPASDVAPVGEGFCKKCRYHGPLEQHGRHKRPQDGHYCNYMARRSPPPLAQSVEPVAGYATPDSTKASAWDAAEAIAKSRGFSGIIAALENAAPVDPVAGEAVDFPDMRRPVIGIERRTAQEVFDIMADRIRLAEAGHYRLAALQGPAA